MESKDEVTRDELLQLLNLDRELDLFLDTDRRREVDALLQDAAELVQKRMGTSGVWIRYAGPRSFDGKARQRSSIFSSIVPDEVRKETTAIADSYRFENESAKRRFDEWPLLERRVGDSFLLAAPIFAEQMKVYVGLFGVLVEAEPREFMVRLVKQLASRVDTVINFKNLAKEHHTVSVRSNELLDQDGTAGLGETLVLLQLLVRAPKAIMVYYDSPFFAERPPHERKVEVLFAEDGHLAPPPEKSFVLHEGLGGNLIEFDGDLRDSRKAMMAIGILDRADGEPREFYSVTLEDRTRHPHQSIGKLVLIGGPPLDQSDQDVVNSVGSQVDTKIVYYHRSKRNLLRSLHPDQVEFFVRRPEIANWFFETPRHEEIAMVFADLCGYTEITRRLADPVETIRVAKEWIIHQIKLTSRHGGLFDKDVGDCAVSLFGPPFYELTVESLLSIVDIDAIEQLMSSIPPDPERYAYQAVMYALDTVEAVRDFQMGENDLHVSIGIEVDRVAIGDLNGNLGSLTAMGDGMNLASRLQGLAREGQIVIGPNCRRRLENYRRNNLATELPFTITEGGNAPLKGYDNPVFYYLVSRGPDES